MFIANTLICAGIATASSIHSSRSLAQHYGTSDPAHHIAHAAWKHGSSAHSPRYAPVPLTSDSSFWYGNFDVGNSKNLSMIIDTGSSDVGVNPGLYKPSTKSVNLNRNISSEYLTAFKNGCGIVMPTARTFNDTVSYTDVHSPHAPISATNQSLYSIIKTKPPNNGTITQLLHDGIVGMAGNNSAHSLLDADPFFYHLCQEGSIADCRFGMALGKQGRGKQIVGGIDKKLFRGPLNRFSTDSFWNTSGNVLVNGSTVLRDVPITLDSGTAGIVGPSDQVRQLFEREGIQAQTVNIPGCVGGVFGYYPCDKPLKLGFTFKGQSRSEVFELDPELFKLADNGNNNCTAWVTGLDFGADGLWIVGQTWFQGKYIDFDYTPPSVGIAPLLK